MSNFKVSFTTALFVFSFIVCVIVAVVFVDRKPNKDYDSFYEGQATPAAATPNTWAGAHTPTPAPTAAPTPAIPTPVPMPLVDLPIDSSLAGASVPLPGAAPAAAANPTHGMSPEDAARFYMNQAKGIPTQPTPIPGMAIPQGMPGAFTPTPAATRSASSGRMPQSRLPLQSNVEGEGAIPAGLGAGMKPNIGLPSVGGNRGTGAPGFSTSNIGNDSWPGISATATPSGMMGIRSAPANGNGMSISNGKTEMDAPPPAGFDGGITKEPAATPITGRSSAAPNLSTSGMTGLEGSTGGVPSLSTGNTGGAGTPASNQQLLYAPGTVPGASSNNKYQLPPAPTLRPPPIVDPDRPLSDAGDPQSNLTPPGGEGPEGSSGQALAVSEAGGIGEGQGLPPLETAQGNGAASSAAPAEGGANPGIAVRVNSISLSNDEAVRLTQSRALLEKKPLTEDTREAKLKVVTDRWIGVTAAAEVAREKGLTVEKDNVDTLVAQDPEVKPAEWRKTMAESGFSAQQIDDLLGDFALATKLAQHEVAEKNSDKDLEKIFKKTPKEFSAPRQVHLLEIYKAKPKDEEQADKVLAEMRRLQRQASSGTDFSLLAGQATEAKDKKVDLGWITPDKQDNETLKRAVADMKPGDISPVLETEDGVYLYKLMEDKPAVTGFEHGRQMVIEKLAKDHLTKTLADARKSQDVEFEPKGQVITARKVKEAKGDKASESEKTSVAKSADAPKDSGPYVKISPPTPSPEPTRQELANSAPQDKSNGVGSITHQALAGGGPAPAQQAGGHTGITASQSLANSAESTAVSRDIISSVMNGNSPAVSSGQGKVQSVLPMQSNGAEVNSSDQLMLEARAMQAKAEADERAHQEDVERTVKQAHAAAKAAEDEKNKNPNAAPTPPVGPTPASAAASSPAPGYPGQPPVASAGQAQPGMPAAVAPAAVQNEPIDRVNMTPQQFFERLQANRVTGPSARTPIPTGPTPSITTSESNGWSVTKQTRTAADIKAEAAAAAQAQANAQQPSEMPSKMPAGFEGSAGSQAPAAPQVAGQVNPAGQPGVADPNIVADPNAQPTQENAQENKPGLAARVKNFFSGGR